jgi:hypothetical protein
MCKTEGLGQRLLACTQHKLVLMTHSWPSPPQNWPSQPPHNSKPYISHPVTAAVAMLALHGQTATRTPRHAKEAVQSMEPNSTKAQHHSPACRCLDCWPRHPCLRGCSAACACAAATLPDPPHHTGLPCRQQQHQQLRQVTIQEGVAQAAGHSRKARMDTSHFVKETHTLVCSHLTADTAQMARAGQVLTVCGVR